MINKYHIFFTSLLLTIYSSSVTAIAPEIKDYCAIFIPGYDQQGNLQIAIRKYNQNSSNYLLVVDPYTLKTEIKTANIFKELESNKIASNKIASNAKAILEETPYLKALNKFSSPPYQLENYGLIESEYSVNGMFLTIDMCPARKPFEKEFFETLVLLANKNNKPVPIALAMSGLWMQNHPEEFAWLIQQKKNNKLAITWMNHSFTHVYYPSLPFKNNFMLLQPDDFDNEIIKTEKILLKNHQVPSVFFRFPGLVADKTLILKSRALGLIPVGSNAWLMKGEVPKMRSIILVHGNSNEPPGIEKMMPLLQKTDLHLLPLSDAIITAGQINK